MVEIILGYKPLKLELLASEELKRYIEKLFGQNVRIASPYNASEDLWDMLRDSRNLPGDSYNLPGNSYDAPGNLCNVSSDSGDIRFLLAAPSRIDRKFVGRWSGEIPGLSDQGFIIQKVDDRTIWLFGGSPAATLWSVYELVESWGVVFTLQGDVFPENIPGFYIPEIDRIYEPRQKIRSWRVFNDLMTGPASWSLKQQTGFINQLVKQKYNGIYICIWPHHPFIDFEVNGISRKSASFNFGIPVPLTPENIGCEHLPHAGSFTNPEFINCKAFSEWYQTGVMYISKVIEHAKSMDMYVTMAFQPFDFPVEFGGLLENPVGVHQLGSLCVAEEGNIYNRGHIKLLQAQFEAYMDTYPGVDIYQIHLPEHARNSNQFENAWQSLDSRFGLSSRHEMEKLLTDCSFNNIAAGGASRAVNEGKMTIIMLDALHRLLDMTGFLSRLHEKGKETAIAAGLSCPSILPVIADAMWPDAHLQVMLGYTSSRSVRNLRIVEKIDAKKVKIEQVLTLQDDNVGSLPQVSTCSIQRLIETAVQYGWNGFYTRFWPIGDLDPVSAFISRTSWEAGTTPEKVYENYTCRLFGKNAVEPVGQALRLLEDATIILDMNHLSCIPPVKNSMAARTGKGKENVMPESLWHIKSVYEETRWILTKTLSCIMTETACSHMRYWIGRMEFSEKILLGISLIANGNKALDDNDAEMARMHYNKAADSFKKALEALASNVRDDSDRGTLAVYYDILIRETGRIIDMTCDKQDTGGEIYE